jgi:ATP-dependent RNA helicase DeaD
MEKRPFTELGLSSESLKAVAKLGFEEASPIQTAVIPAILAGRDVVGHPHGPGRRGHHMSYPTRR